MRIRLKIIDYKLTKKINMAQEDQQNPNQTPGMNPMGTPSGGSDSKGPVIGIIIIILILIVGAIYVFAQGDDLAPEDDPMPPAEEDILGPNEDMEPIDPFEDEFDEEFDEDGEM